MLSYVLRARRFRRRVTVVCHVVMSNHGKRKELLILHIKECRKEKKTHPEREKKTGR